MYSILLLFIFPPRLPVAVVALLYVATGNLFAAEVLEGPVSAQVIRVIDGDTIAASATIWPGQSIRIYVRVNGVDTPELKGKCPFEKKLANLARRFVINWTFSGQIKLKNIKQGKYAGRIIADVYDTNGRNLAAGLLKQGLAIKYAGGKKTLWCSPKPSQTASRRFGEN